MKIRHQPTPDVYINVAPLVEVMLVLIIIFMLTAPTLNVGVPVDLPKTSASELNDTKNLPVVISINKYGDLFVDETKLSTDELIQKLPHILQTGNTDTVYVRGDKDLPYGTIMNIMGIISSSGTCKVSLIATPDDKGKFTKNKNISNSATAQKITKPQR